MKIKEHFRQNVIKWGEKNPAGISQDLFKNPGIFYSGIFQALRSRDYLVPGFYDPVDIPSQKYVVPGVLVIQIQIQAVWRQSTDYCS